MAVTSLISTAATIGLSVLSPSHTRYSFTDLVGVMAHSLVGSYPFTGKGIGQIDISMDSEKTSHEKDVHGTVIVVRIPGSKSGKFVIQCQQESDVHFWLLYLYTKLAYESARYWAQTNVLLRNVRNGVEHHMRGVAFDRNAPVSYAAQGGMVTWTLMAAEIVTTTPNPSGAGQKSALQKKLGL